MTATNPTTYHLSASSISAFKACPTRFRLQYREGLRVAQDSDIQRVGTNWHKMHEVYAEALEPQDPEKGVTPESMALEAVIDHLNERYSVAPSYLTAEEFALEREILVRSFIAYQWYWSNDPLEFLANELAFDLPLHMPRTGLPLPMDQVRRVGKIDHVVKWQGAVCALERKSTSRSIAPDSDFWDRSRKDTQVSMYALAFRDLMAAGLLPEPVRQVFHRGGVEDQPARYGNTLYDVWHKPTIKPAMLTQAETAKFMSTGEYCGESFNIETEPHARFEWTPVSVGGDFVGIEEGKKGYAIRETTAMFGARLLQDIYTRPDFYFQRREISRTDEQIREFRGQLFAIYTAQKAFEKSGCWYENESQCRATFACPYIPICYGPGAAAVCDGKTTPPGFKRIFVDLTINGQAVEE